MASLTLYQDYTRSEIHDLFDPNSPFTLGSGSWGIWGILKVPNRPSDYVFIVSIGQEISGHAFNESITDEGVLSWQSQPGQTLNEARIVDFINHDESVNSIYLFIRPVTSGRTPYTYLGRLKYLTHDAQSQRPVYFKWQILDWDMNAPAIARFASVLTATVVDVPPIQSDPLMETAPPASRARHGLGTGGFGEFMASDDPNRDYSNKQLGTAGEKLVVAHEQQFLNGIGRPDLANRVRHIALDEGDGAGYDVLSFSPNGSERYIEVKTTRGPSSASFFITPNEVRTSQLHRQAFRLYRLYRYNDALDFAKFYVLQGDMEEKLDLRPTVYRATIKTV